MSKKINKLSLFVIFLFSVIFVFGQITEATLKGSVTDSLGNIIVASAIVAQSNTTEKIYTTTTDNGEFVFASLPAESYTVFVRVPGFKTYELKNLKLNVGQTSELSVKLEIGDIQTTVQVGQNDSVLAISKEARISDTFTHREVSELPSIRRSDYQKKNFLFRFI